MEHRLPSAFDIPCSTFDIPPHPCYPALPGDL